MTQTPMLSNSFVSQRAYGLLFERNSNGVLFVDRFESGSTSAWSPSQGE